MKEINKIWQKILHPQKINYLKKTYPYTIIYVFSMKKKCKHMHGLCNKPKPFYLVPLSMQCDNKYCINKCFNSLLFTQYY